jgi:hypothetical protein
MRLKRRASEAATDAFANAGPAISAAASSCSAGMAREEVSSRRQSGIAPGSANHHAATKAREGSCMNKRRVWMIILIIIGVALIALAIYYWVTPAGSLPSFFPGHLAGSAHKHM